MLTMDIEKIKNKKIEILSWKNIKPIYEELLKIKDINIKDLEIFFDDYIKIGHKNDLNKIEKNIIEKVSKKLIPWRKGPFNIFGLDIQSEWNSYIKYNLIRPYFNLENKIVADVGCNNGYYLFKMINDKPKRLIGFDPSPLSYLQFKFINYFIKSDIVYELLGVEHLSFYNHKFDFIFMLGVLYHRSDPICALKSLNRSLNSNGEILIDTFMIDCDDDMCLTPKNTYSKIPNIYFIPTIKALKNWLYRSGFINIEILNISITSNNEQRVTKWSNEQSLDDFLDPYDKTKTIEGYCAPKRVYLKAKKR